MSHPSGPPATARGHLRDWQASATTDFSDDPALHRALRLYLEPARYEAFLPILAQAGRDAATLVDPAADLYEQRDHLPRLQRWSPIGERIEQVLFHPAYHDAGRAIYGSGLLASQVEPGHAVEQAALLYLFGQCGEAGHLCPVVCTAGLIRVLQAAAPPELQQRFLPPLLDARYDHRHSGAQSLTEIQGGSDVGANAVSACPGPTGDGSWRVNGEKWFFSNATAEQILITARPEGAPAGTAGLALFLVPRHRPDGTLNGLYLRRLKEKFGTRAMASAEVEFQDALAYPLGEPGDGIHLVLEHVLNTSRWLNAVGSLALLRRGLREAARYARHRHAFGQPIGRYPLVQESLATMSVSLAGALAATWRLSHLRERLDLGTEDGDLAAAYRFLVNLNKVRSSIVSALALRRAQELLGGNGAIEDFSIVPRLYRDAVVYESWEGSHNVLCLQLLRDMRRYAMHEPFLALLRADLDRVTQPALMTLAAEAGERLDGIADALDRLVEGPPRHAEAHVRRLLDRLAAVAEGIFLLAEAERAPHVGAAPPSGDQLRLFFDLQMTPGYDPIDDRAFLDRTAAVATEEMDA